MFCIRAQGGLGIRAQGGLGLSAQGGLRVRAHGGLKSVHKVAPGGVGQEACQVVNGGAPPLMPLQASRLNTEYQHKALCCNL